MELNDPYVRIWHPVWASVEVDDPSLPMVREAVNITNYENVPTVVMTAPNSKGFIGLLSRCDLMIYPPVVFMKYMSRQRSIHSLMLRSM